MPANAAVYGCQGMELLADERAFFREARPWGFILFGRNCSDRAQVSALARSLRECVYDPRAPIFIDQEGGRVARLRPPHWRARPAAQRIGELYANDAAQGREAAYLTARLIAHDLREVGVTVDCAPVLDVPVEGAHDVIGDRAFARDAAVVIELGRAEIEGFLDGGVLPVIKHMPGHGRAFADSHKELPRVSASLEELSASDFVTFRSLNQAPIAMTAHVVYDCVDAQRPATTSAKLIREIIRGEIGFGGLLVSDDLSMNALDGPLGVRARSALFAGCDVVIHCNGRMDEMKEVAAEAKPLEGMSLQRADAALALVNEPRAAIDVEAGEARLAELLGVVA
jgi:beta-N-acetylhexosaminidase